MLTLYFDYPFAASVVALLRLQRLADAGVAVAFEGFDPLGLDTALPVTLDQYEEIERHGREAADLGFALRRPSRRPSTLSAHLVGEVATRAGQGAAWRQACLAAYWHDDADLGDHGTLLALAAAAGLDLADVGEALGERAARLRLRQRMVVLRSRGIGGVPVLEVAGGTLVSPDLPDHDLRSLAGL